MELTATAPPKQHPPAPVPVSSDLYFDFDLSWHNDLPGVLDTIIEFTGYCTSRNAPSKALILAGYSGCGKTHLANLVDQYARLDTEMINEVLLFEQLKALYSKKEDTSPIFKRLRQARVLIYDDLGSGRGNDEWREDLYYRLFDTDQAFIITTNLSRVDLAARVGQRVTSRLQGAARNRENVIDMFKIGDYRAKQW